MCDKNLKEYFSHITFQRSALMGLAMIAVFLTHAPSETLGFLPTGFVGIIADYGFWGVDVFLFLSAFGLCHSLQKNDIKTFFRNRFIRILPLWLIVLLSIHVLGAFLTSTMPGLDFVYPNTFIDCIYWYTGLGFYLNTCSYEWYIPSLLLLYFISPLIYKISRYTLYIVIPISIVIYTLNHYYGFQHLDILFERIPVFLLGFLYFKEYKEGKLLRFLLAELIFLLIILPSIYFGICTSTILFGILSPVILMTVSNILSKKFIKPISFCLAFVGSISLEFYLIHLYRRPQFLLSIFIDNSNLQVLFAFILCLILSYILHIIMEKVLAKLNLR